MLNGELVISEAIAIERTMKVALPLESENGSIGPFGDLFPVFDPPTGFKLRLGARSSDFFVTGTFPAGTRTVGFIRIPTMSPSNTSAAFTQFVDEFVFLQANTDRLVVDVMANGGGNGCYAESLVSALMPTAFRGLAFQIRPTKFWIKIFGNRLINSQLSNSPEYMQVLYAEYLRQIEVAYAENRGNTGAIPICGVRFDVSPVQDLTGRALAYTKPILV